MTLVEELERAAALEQAAVNRMSWNDTLMIRAAVAITMAIDALKRNEDRDDIIRLLER